MKDLLDWITAIGAGLVVYAALSHPLYPPGSASARKASRPPPQCGGDAEDAAAEPPLR